MKITLMKNIFTKAISEEVIQRINKLNKDSKGQWGKMSVGQMLAHCNVAYEMVYEDIHKKPGAFVRFMLKLLVKNSVVNEKPYPKNSKTAPQFIIKGSKNFEQEKVRLIGYIERTQTLGESHFDQKSSHSFGPLSITEWNNLFYKHLDHHMTQFGV